MVCGNLVPWWYLKDRCSQCERVRMHAATQLIAAAFTIGIACYALGLIKAFVVLSVASIILMFGEAVIWRLREVRYEMSLTEGLAERQLPPETCRGTIVRDRGDR